MTKATPTDPSIGPAAALSKAGQQAAFNLSILRLGTMAEALRFERQPLPAMRCSGK